MKRLTLIICLFIAHTLSYSQVGVGTNIPNPKSILDLHSSSQGLLIPRMTYEEKQSMNLGTGDAGMMIYQTNLSPAAPYYPKGLYFFDGSGWMSPVKNGTESGQTLRWDGGKWAYTDNLFNQGSSIGIGTKNPKSQLQIHSTSFPTTRLQLTNANTGALTEDGLMLGLTLSNSHAHILQNENKPLWFGTNAMERMRIDSAGNVGINQTQPQARLDVNGSVRLGENGSVLSGIMKTSMEVLIPEMDSMEYASLPIACPNTLANAVVYVSPASSLEEIMIMCARVSSPGMLEVKLMNMGPAMADPLPVTFHIAVIQ